MFGINDEILLDCIDQAVQVLPNIATFEAQRSCCNIIVANLGSGEPGSSIRSGSGFWENCTNLATVRNLVLRLYCFTFWWSSPFCFLDGGGIVDRSDAAALPARERWLAARLDAIIRNGKRLSDCPEQTQKKKLVFEAQNLPHISIHNIGPRL